MKYSDIHIVLKINKTIVQGSYEFFESQLFNNFPANILLPIQFEKDLTQPQGIVYTFKLMKKIFLWEFLYCWKLLRLKLCFSIVLINPQAEKSHYFVSWKFHFWIIIKNYDYNIEPCLIRETRHWNILHGPLIGLNPSDLFFSDFSAHLFQYLDHNLGFWGFFT